MAAVIDMRRLKDLLRKFAGAAGIICLFVAAYFLLLLALSPAYAKAMEIYELAEQFNRGAAFSGRDLIAVAVPAAAAFAFGVWSGYRKARI